MTLINPPTWLQSTPGDVGYSANDDRLVIGSIVSAAGVTSSTSMVVTQTTSPSMFLDISSGTAFVEGTEATYQGMYHCVNNGTVQVQIPDSSSSNPRIDIVVLKIYDEEQSGTENKAEFLVIEGTPTLSPSAPAAPDNSIVLAEVYVPTSATSILTANITDARPTARLNTYMQSLPTGATIPFLGSTAPSGFLIANGAAVSRTTFANLFSVTGTQYGAGNGSTTFNLPNIKGRVVVGLDTAQSEFNVLGETGGAKTHTLSVTEIPSHTHTQNPHSHTQRFHNAPGGAPIGTANTPVGGNGVVATTNVTTADTTATNQSTGGGGAHNNLQPYIVLNWIVKI